MTLRLIFLAFVALALAFASGCGGSRTVFIPEDSPIRMGPSVRARVYTYQTGEWVLSANQVEIPEGWYCVSPSFVKDEPTAGSP